VSGFLLLGSSSGNEQNTIFGFAQFNSSYTLNQLQNSDFVRINYEDFSRSLFVVKSGKNPCYPIRHISERPCLSARLSDAFRLLILFAKISLVLQYTMNTLACTVSLTVFSLEGIYKKSNKTFQPIYVPDF
jgi:hypothetical protein